MDKAEMFIAAIDALEAVWNRKRRDLFAGLAMAGMLSDPEEVDTSKGELAKHSVQYADALIAELDKEA